MGIKQIKMRKKTITIVGSFLIFAMSIGLYANSLQFIEQLSQQNVEALTYEECFNKPGYNDGHCETDGTIYLCANKGFLERRDCVKDTAID